jgi:hypothetical protein
MQISGKELSKTLFENLQQNDFLEGLSKYQHVDDSFEFINQTAEFSYRLGGRFLYHNEGYELDNFFQIIQINEIESFIATILTDSGLKHVSNGTFIRDTKIRERTDSFKKLSNLRITYDNFNEFKELMTLGLNNTIVPFFIEFSNTKMVAEYVNNVNFGDLINSAIMGEYPSNYFKAIYLFKKYGFEQKFEEYLKNLAMWIEEDKSDPNYGHMYENYKNGFENLIDKLKN